MAKCNCSFDHDWLIEFKWLEKGPIARTAYCHPCHHTCDISSMGRSAVTRHSKGKKYKDNEIYRKSLMSLTVSDLDPRTIYNFPILIFRYAA